MRVTSVLVGWGLALVLFAGACAPAAPPAPTATVAKPATAPSPVAASPAAKPAESPAAKPAAAASPSPSPSPAAAAKPAASTAQIDQGLASNWQGKTVTISVGFPPGGGYDAWARLIARHLGRYIPGNPSVIVENRPGAGGIVQANQLYEARPDGLNLGLIERGMGTFQLRGEEGVRYDVSKFGWLGSATVEAFFLVLPASAGVTDGNQLKSREVRIGEAQVGGLTHGIGAVLKEGLGWQIKPIFGYEGQAGTVLAMERGETNGVIIGWSSLVTQKRDELASKALVPLVQVGYPQNDPLVANVPRGQDLFKDLPLESRQLLTLIEAPLSWSRPLVAPPGMDPRMLGTLRAAFMATLADAEFKADAERLKFDVVPVTGEQVDALVQEYMRTPRPVFDRLTKLVAEEAPS